MKLRIKNLPWLAGKPVVILHPKTAEKLNVFQNQRVLLSNSHDFYCIVDIFPNLVKKNEIGLSQEVTKIFSAKNEDDIDVSAAIISPASKLIKRKLEGHLLKKEEMETIIKEIVNNNLTEAEIAYFIAAQKTQKMTLKEIISLTEAMIQTGEKMVFQNKEVVDKHCIGGVAGNRTTPIVVAICASLGLTFPKTSSRAITSASGTADVIETISKVDIKVKDLKRIVEKTNGCMAWGGSLKLAPSDDKIIQIERLINLDVESQLIASILSKKITAGAKYVLIDIPYGKNSKVKSWYSAKKLGKRFKKIAKYFNLKLNVVYTNGKLPIGNGFGPVLEMNDVLKVLQNKKDAPKDLRKKSLYLSSELIKLAGKRNSKNIVKQALDSGIAYEKFKQIINAQNNKDNFEKKIKALKTARFRVTIKSNKRGKIINIKNNKINEICRILGTPENLGAGIYLYKSIGKVKKDEKLLTMFSDNKRKLERAIKFFNEENVIEIKFKRK
jgi:thymidine phosphorylase